MSLLSFAGPDALSTFRLEALRARCREAVGEVDALEARFVYLVHVKDTSSDETQLVSRLASILDANPLAGGLTSNATRLLITPRPGTTSPWSTKATDILRNCGLSEVERVERATVYSFASTNNAELNSTALQPLHPLLSDLSSV